MTVDITRTAVNTLVLASGDEKIELTRSELEELLENVKPSNSGTIINPRDFSDSTLDVNRDRWDGGKLRAVLAALPEGKRVNVVTDTQTGHTLFGVELVGVSGASYGGGEVLIVRYHHHLGDQGPGYHDTAFSVRSIGAITVPAESTVKWDALAFWRSECSAAMYVARPIAEAQHGQNYGRWRMQLTLRGVHVKYEPQRPDAGPVGYGEVVDGQLVRWSTYGGYDGPLGSYRDLGLGDSCGACGRPANEVADHVVDGVVYHAQCIPAAH